MRRIIRFRAKTIQGYVEAPENTWVYGYYTEASCIVESGVPCIQTNVNDYLVDRNTVGEFIGKTDHTGKDIYEGDIVQMPTYTACGMAMVCDGHENYVITFDKCCGAFYAEALHTHDCLSLDELDIEAKIIGNIYDNPELLQDISELSTAPYILEQEYGIHTKEVK